MSATAAPAIVIPSALLPADGRFGSGPSKVPVAAVRQMAAQAPFGTSHRQAPVRTLVARVRAGLGQLLAVPDGYEVLAGNGGSTAFWDAAAFGLVQERAQHVVCGEFSAKFAAITTGAPFLAAPDVRRVEPGAGREPVAAVGVDTYAWPQNETSTGVTLPVRRVRGADDGALMLVDATSSAGAIETDLAEVDAYYFAPQKVFAAEAGLWFAVLAPAALERVAAIAGGGRWIPPSLDLQLALANSRLDQTYNTPAIGSLWLMAHQVEDLLARGGVHWAAARSAASAAALYGWAERSHYATPFVADPARRSPVVGTIDLDPAIDAAWVAATLRANGVVDTEPYRGLGRNQLRIGMYPAVDPGDVAALTACIDFVVGAAAA
ncbi:MAG: phosphoserine transaminase [bacterium]